MDRQGAEEKLNSTMSSAYPRVSGRPVIRRNYAGELEGIRGHAQQWLSIQAQRRERKIVREVFDTSDGWVFQRLRRSMPPEAHKVARRLRFSRTRIANEIFGALRSSSVGMHCADFTQTSDEEVIDLLFQAACGAVRCCAKPARMSRARSANLWSTKE